MNEQLTALAPDGDRTMDFSVDDPAEPPSDERAAAKFVYPGGSQPLDGYTIKRGVGHGGFGGQNVKADIKNKLTFAYVSNGLKATASGQPAATFANLERAVYASMLTNPILGGGGQQPQQNNNNNNGNNNNAPATTNAAAQ